MEGFKHQMLEVVASSVLFNITNPTLPPDVESLFFAFDKNMVVFTLISFWLFLYICLSSVKMPILSRVGEFFPIQGIIMFCGFITKVLMGFMDLDFSPTRDVLKHLMITPIILHNAYSLYHPNCYGQLRTILAISLTATVLNVGILALLLYVVYAPWLDPDLTVFDCLTFSSIISAVDPVEILAVMEGVKEHSPLYYLVLAGSIFNDGLSFSLFEGFKPFTYFSKEEISSEFDLTTLGYLTGCLLVDPLVGGVLGWGAAHLASIIVMYIDNEAKLNYLKPLIILLLASLAYLISLIFGFSAVISLIVYGVTAEWLTSQSNQVHSTTTEGASLPITITISHIMDGLAATLHILLFFYIGFESTELINSFRDIWKFSLSALLLMTVARLIVTPVFCNLFNLLELYGLTNYRISWRWQVLIISGGMRGAISFCMALELGAKEFQDTTVFIIFATTILNGIAVKLLSRLLHIKETGTELIALPSTELQS